MKLELELARRSGAAGCKTTVGSLRLMRLNTPNDYYEFESQNFISYLICCCLCTQLFQVKTKYIRAQKQGH
jgi:hypothetical protein